jgi:hypothetical protein
MKNKTLGCRVVLILAVCLLFTACSKHVVKQRVLMPANSSSMKDVKKLAVLGFSGDRNKLFSNRVESFLTGIRVNNKPYFTVIDRNVLNETLRNQVTGAGSNAAEAITATTTATNSQAATTAAAATADTTTGESSGENTGIILTVNDPMSILGALLTEAVDRKTGTTTTVTEMPAAQTNGSSSPGNTSNLTRADAIKLAKLSGADTVVTGSVTGPHVKNTRYNEERSECVEYSKEKTKKVLGIKVKECLKYKKTTVACVKQQGNIDFNLKAVNVESSDITFSNTYAGAIENTYCSDNEKYKKQTAEALAEKVTAQALGKMRNDVAPYSVVLSIELMDGDDSGLGDNQNAKMLLESGLEFAKNSQLSVACDKFRMASESYSQSPAILHNLGVCSEIKNQLTEAASLYQQAEGLLLKPNKTISSALVRVSNRVSQQEQVAKQMR